MAALDPLEVLKEVYEDSDWNDSDDEDESGSDDENADGLGEIDYLMEAQVI